MFASSANVVRRAPVATLLLAGCSLAAYCLPQLASRLVYDRSAILAGEVWRLVTGHLVHFSPSHLVYDLIAFGVAGWIIEHRSDARFGLLCIVTATLIGVTVFTFAPAVRFYGGLSGLVFAAIAYLSVSGMVRPGRSRWLCMAVLSVLAAKIGWECVLGKPVFAMVAESGCVVLPLCHAAGCLSGLWMWCVCRPQEERLTRGEACT